MKKLAFAIIIVPFFVIAQDEWVRYWGSSQHLYGEGYCIQESSNGEYVVVGGIGGAHAGSMCLWLLKIDSQGDTVWTRQYGNSYEQDKGHWIQETRDGEYIVTGCTHDDRLWLLKMDSDGDTIWTQSFGGSHSSNGNCIIESSDGGYVVLGWIANGASYERNLYLLKTNSQGALIWSHAYGASNGEEGYCLRQTKDGGFIIVGVRKIERDTYVFQPIWLLKTNAIGDTLWTRTYGEENTMNIAYSVSETEDGGFVITGGKEEAPGSVKHDLWLIKTNSKGEALWSKVYGSANRNEEGSIVQTTLDGDYVIIGDSYGVPWLLKTDSNGDTLWSRIYRIGKGRAMGLRNLNDGYLITTIGHNKGPLLGNLLVIKTDSLGNVPLEISPTLILAPKGGADVFHMTPEAYFMNLSTYETQDFYCTCEISDPSSNQVFYKDSVRITKNLASFDTLDVKFSEWTSDSGSSYKARFYAHSATVDSFRSRPMSVSFHWTSIAEQPHVTPQPGFEVLSPIGPQIKLRFAEAKQSQTVNVFDASGKKVDEVSVPQSGGLLSWGDCYGPGVYFMRVEGEGNHSTHKVVLVR